LKFDPRKQVNVAETFYICTSILKITNSSSKGVCAIGVEILCSINFLLVKELSEYLEIEKETAITNV
jgi:hypothetical protein